MDHDDEPDDVVSNLHRRLRALRALRSCSSTRRNSRHGPRGVGTHVEDRPDLTTYAKITSVDSRFTLMYAYPIQALILFSSLCTNWWCGSAAITVFESSQRASTACAATHCGTRASTSWPCAT